MKKVILILGMFLLASASVSATVISSNFGDASVNISDSHIEVIYSDSLILRVSTSVSKVCRYSTIPWTPFENMTSFHHNFEVVHEKTFTGLTDGIYRYFVRCTEMPGGISPLTDVAELEIAFRINLPIEAQVVIDNNALNAGKYKVSLITTKIPSTTPKLSYSYDGISYSPIILHGSGNDWDGFLIVPKSAGEKIGSFKFEATGLDGKSGSKIISGDMFLIDTVPPSQISNIEATGEYRQIKLEWFSPEDDIMDVNIYRSQYPGVTMADFYKTINGEDGYYLDKDVSKSVRYYYKVSLMDEASNIATLSPEVSATTRIDNNTITSGLSSDLISLVDALLVEVRLVEDDADNAKSLLKDKTDSEQELLRLIGITDSVSSSSSELNALEREIISYKLQNINSDTLNMKLASSRIKLNIIKKKIPISISTMDYSKKEIKINEEDLRTALVEYAPELIPSQIDKSVKESFKMIKENNIKLTSEITVFEMRYLDGSSSEKSVIRHSINSKLERGSGASLLLKLPLALNSDHIKIKNLDYSEEKYDLFRFETDTKFITYTLDEKTDVKILDKIILVPVIISKNTGLLTGYFLSEIPGTGSFAMAFLIIMAAILISYLTIMRKKQQSHSIISFIEKAKKVKEFQNNGNHNEANSLYNSLQIDYTNLTNRQKSKVFNKISHLHKK